MMVGMLWENGDEETKDLRGGHTLSLVWRDLFPSRVHRQALRKLCLGLRRDVRWGC